MVDFLFFFKPRGTFSLHSPSLNERQRNLTEVEYEKKNEDKISNRRSTCYHFPPRYPIHCFHPRCQTSTCFAP